MLSSVLYASMDPVAEAEDVTIIDVPCGGGVALRARGRLMFAVGARRGHPVPPSRAELDEWMRGAGLADPVIGSERGFVTFSAVKPRAAQRAPEMSRPADLR